MIMDWMWLLWREQVRLNHSVSQLNVYCIHNGLCTGSGKTAAFLIPMFEKLKAHSTTGIVCVCVWCVCVCVCVCCELWINP